MATEMVFLGAKKIGAACFEYLLNHAEALDIHVCAVKSRSGDAGADILSKAASERIPILSDLKEMPECDIIYSVQHHELLKKEHLVKARKIAVNLHLAPLPDYRGCNQFTFAILEEAKEFGVTIHQIDTRIDHGAILFQDRFPIPEKCWVKELYDLAEIRGEQLFQQTISKIIHGEYVLREQESLMTKQTSVLHFRNEIEAVKNIPLNLSAEDIERRVRATMMPGFEPPFCFIDDQKIYFSREAEG